jgi:hypothetical protein
VRGLWILGFLSLLTLIGNYLHLLFYPEQWVSSVAANDWGETFQLAFYGTLGLPLAAIALDFVAFSFEPECDVHPPKQVKQD